MFFTATLTWFGCAFSMLMPLTIFSLLDFSNTMDGPTGPYQLQPLSSTIIKGFFLIVAFFRLTILSVPCLHLLFLSPCSSSFSDYLRSTSYADAILHHGRTEQPIRCARFRVFHNGAGIHASDDVLAEAFHNGLVSELNLTPTDVCLARKLYGLCAYC